MAVNPHHGGMTNALFIYGAIESMKRDIEAAGPGTPAVPETPRELRRQRRAAAAHGRG
jgi:hypothetical protein